MKLFLFLLMLLVVYFLPVKCISKKEHPNEFESLKGILFQSKYPSQSQEDNTVTLKSQTNVNDSSLLTNFTFCLEFLINSISPQSVFSSSYMSFWIDSTEEKIGVLSFGERHVFLFSFNSVRLPLHLITFCVCKIEIKDGTQITIVLNNKIVLDSFKESSKIYLPRNLFHNFTLGGFIQKPLGTFNVLPFRGYISRIFASSNVYQKSINISYWAMYGELMHPDLYNWNKDYDVLHKGKNIDFKDEKLNNFGKMFRFKRQIAMAPLDHAEACRSCRYLNGILTDVKETEFEYVWFRGDKFDSCNSKSDVVWNKMKGLIRWDVGEPNGGSIQNCVIYHPSTKTYKDEYCHLKYPYHCFLSKTDFLYTLHGVPSSLMPEIDSRYFLLHSDNKLLFYGVGNNLILENEDSKWVITLIHNPKKIVAYFNNISLYPWGKNLWFFMGDDGVISEKRYLLLTRCLEKEFSCNDGFCIPMYSVCDNNPDCSDAEDEENCSLIEPLAYRKEVPPFFITKTQKSVINIRFHLKSIDSIQEMKNMYDISFVIELKWSDPRLLFNNLNNYEEHPLTGIEREKIWVPPLTFDNSAGNDIRISLDGDVQISAMKKLGTTGIFNSVSALQKKLKYSGSNVTLTLRVSKMMSMFCVFDFHHYPFDTQKCKVKIGLALEVQDRVVFNIDRGASASSDPIDLLQYEMKSLTFDLIESQGIVVIELQRMFNNILWTTYLPTFYLQIVAILTLFFPSKRFDTTVMITITTTLVIYTLYQGVSISLPYTAFCKMIDYWLFFSLIMPFFVFVLEVFLELGASFLIEGNCNSFGRICVLLLSKYGKIIIIFITITFDISYWIYNLLFYYSII